MPRLTKNDLLSIVTGSVSECGWNILYLESPITHPFRLQIYKNDESYRLRIYIWNLTHGGGSARPRGEYRICGVQLDLVQAAHIVPVSYEKGTDHTSNGMALCALHHYAYDRGLVFVDEDYSIELNERKINKLRAISRDEGLQAFTEALRDLILLPPATSDRPHRDYLSIANSLRLEA